MGSCQESSTDMEQGKVLGTSQTSSVQFTESALGPVHVPEPNKITRAIQIGGNTLESSGRIAINSGAEKAID